MTENSKEEFLPYIHILDEVLKKLTYSDFVSVFFLLMEKYISPKCYLKIIEQNESEKINLLKQILLHHHVKNTFSKNLLIEILWTIKRYDLLKNLNICRHNYKYQSSSLSRIWKSLYEICDSFDIEEDLKYFEKVFREVSISDDDHLEVFIVKEYNAETISKSCLESLLTDLNKENQKSRTWALPEEYVLKQPTITSPCGLAIIINHENFICEENGGPELRKRKDSSLDVDALNKLWESFGFVTRTYLDYKKEEMLDAFKELSEEDLANYDIFVVCYMSHGNEGVVYSSDCKPIQISCLIDFMSNKCKSLIDKPKLFFIQACQGTHIQCGISHPIFSPQPGTNSSCTRYPGDTPLYIDVLVAVSTIPGFASFASDNKNSWFIEALVENMERYGHQKGLFEVMTKVTNAVSNKRGQCKIQEEYIFNCKQTVEIKSTLRYGLQLKKILT